MKKLGIALIVLTISATVAFAATMSFSDVKSGDWFYNGVVYSSQNDLMTGYSDGTFSPNEPVTRGQFATVLERMDAEKIDNMYYELAARRSFEVSELIGSSWIEYKDVMTKYPTMGIQASGIVDVKYEDVSANLVVMATDPDGDELLSNPNASAGYFFIYAHGMADVTYGPFVDNVDRLVSEIEAL